jgi:hypothetical protein
MFIFVIIAFTYNNINAEKSYSYDKAILTAEAEKKKTIFNELTIKNLRPTLKQLDELLIFMHEDEAYLQKRVMENTDNKMQKKLNSLWIEKRKQIALLESRKKEIEELIISISNEIKRIKNLKNE